jgi:GntR family transcriptional regulator
VSSDLLSFTLVFASKDVAEKLQIHPRDPAYEILRLRKVDRNPYVLERLYLSPALIPGINENILSKSLYSYIENTLHLSISSASQVIRADRATPLDQQQLKISSSDPVLEISQIAYLQNGKPFEYSINRYHHRHATTSLILTRSESQL